tara:strand:- start:473 stop:631 length:159 start_codon:yes stop_codon:yes gene_type:complete
MKNKKKKIEPIVLAAIIIVGVFFAYKLLQIVACSSDWNESFKSCFVYVFSKN